MSSYHFDFCDIVKGLYTVHLQWIAVAFINIIAFTKKKRTHKNKTKLEGTLRILTCLCISTQTDAVTTSSCGERNCHSFTPKNTLNDGHQFCVSICFVYFFYCQ